MRVHAKDSLANRNYLNNWKTRSLEVLSFITLWFVSIAGLSADKNALFNVMPDHYIAICNFICIAIQLFGLSLSYIVYLALNPACKDLPFYRLSKLTRIFFSSSFWIPFATLSYSCYLFHIGLIISIPFQFEYFNTYKQLFKDDPVALDQIPGTAPLFYEWFNTTIT